MYNVKIKSTVFLLVMMCCYDVIYSSSPILVVLVVGCKLQIHTHWVLYRRGSTRRIGDDETNGKMMTARLKILGRGYNMTIHSNSIRSRVVVQLTSEKVIFQVFEAKWRKSCSLRKRFNELHDANE